MSKIILTKKYKRFLYLSIAILWMLMIYSFSSQNGTSSGGLSNTILQWIATIFQIDIQDSAYYEFFQLCIRKGAHMFEYFMLAIWFNLYLEQTNLSTKARWLALLGCFLYACSDEFHQLFINGRSGQFSDVLIDTSGACIAMIIFPLLYHRLTQKPSQDKT